MFAYVFQLFIEYSKISEYFHTNGKKKMGEKLKDL